MELAQGSQDSADESGTFMQFLQSKTNGIALSVSIASSFYSHEFAFDVDVRTTYDPWVTNADAQWYTRITIA